VFPPAWFIVISISFQGIDARQSKDTEAIRSASEKAPIFPARTSRLNPSTSNIARSASLVSAAGVRLCKLLLSTIFAHRPTRHVRSGNEGAPMAADVTCGFGRILEKHGGLKTRHAISTPRKISIGKVSATRSL
jgi:hypothetical protein